MKTSENRSSESDGPYTCSGGKCPALHVTDSGDIVLKGYKVSGQDRDAFNVEGEEDVVRVPEQIFNELIQQYQGS